MRRRLGYWLLTIIFFNSYAFAQNLCDFDGSLDLNGQKLDLVLFFPENGKMVNSFSRDGKLVHLNSRMEHVRLNQADLSTDLESSISLERDGAGRLQEIRGIFWTRYTLLNYKPFQESSGSFYIKKGKLHIGNLSWGEVSFNGYLNLMGPFDLDIAIEIKDMDINALAPFIGIKTEDPFISGLVSGRIKVSGRLKKMQLRGSLRSEEGQLQDFIYRDASINFSGYYPKLDIIDSAISDEQGFVYNLAGRFNLEEINNFISQEHRINISPFSDEDLKSHAMTIRKKDSLSKDTELEMGIKLRTDKPSEALTGRKDGLLGIGHKQRF